MRLIDAEELEKSLTYDFCGKPLHGNHKTNYANIRASILAQPTINPETLPEVIAMKKQIAELTAERDAWSKNFKLIVRGTNLSEQHPADEFICSEFGFTTQEFNSYDPEEDAYYEFIIKFCPNCGADMRGEQG